MRHDIPFNLGNFGSVQWEKSLIGNMYLADPIDACSPL